MKLKTIKTYLFIFCLCASCLTAQSAVPLKEYAAMVGNINPTTQRIPTLNDNGAAMCFTTELTEAFLEQCRDSSCHLVLEVGCAYGIKASQIVQTGVFLVANDVEPRHLDIMKQIFSQLSKTYPNFNNVEYLIGDFSTLEEEKLCKKYDAILCESVLHFMKPDEWRKTLTNFNMSLRNGGKVFITVLSPYHPEFMDTFETNKAEGLEWPGIFYDPEGISPVIYNIVDEGILIRELEHAGFRVVKSKYIPKAFLEQESQYDGRDWLIAIAEKVPQSSEFESSSDVLWDKDDKLVRGE